ncbi:hypothetical protein ACH4OX_36245 [Streptomyces roseolus]|uniref:hypothetical protein n=1 Tax=Streptomyces roseolus TaxID=67358 RepID=UPI0037A6C65A
MPQHHDEHNDDRRRSDEHATPRVPRARQPHPVENWDTARSARPPRQRGSENN